MGCPSRWRTTRSCAAYAEFKLGAGRGTDDLLALTLGTGVGGGVVSGGRLFRAYTELGHMVIVEDGEPCQGACSGRGHVEAYCSGTAATRLAKRVSGRRQTRTTSSSRVIRRSVRSATTSARRSARWSTSSARPRVVIGGGFGIAAFDHLVAAARRAVLREALAPSGQSLEIVRAELGGQAGLIGAALVALEGL